ncbi:hypothetical protein OH809_43905 (plasmid) [Streptomyces sp. NBC_00873]|uniref:hypothetical protein n=1 Tax=unclassified Streptomyces TaxID=2593676 RepID=UPI002F915DE1|nr:hypothetical protein OH809_43905 [Streptomyces sp. NBC_00873]WTA49176.1 hypothetical protein OH821_44590 [Streptomyces sp. NBC_00842]
MIENALTSLVSVARLVHRLSAVDLRHQFTIRSAGGFEVLVAFGEFAAQIEDLLFQLGGAACERLDVGWGAEAGGFPDCLAQGLGQAPFESGDVCGQSPVVGREVRDVGQQRLAADLRSGGRAGRGFARAGDDRNGQPWPPALTLLGSTQMP